MGGKIIPGGKTISGGKAISKTGQEPCSAQLGQLKTGKDGKGLLRIHPWCPDDLPRLWDNEIENRNRLSYESLVLHSYILEPSEVQK